MNASDEISDKSKENLKQETESDQFDEIAEPNGNYGETNQNKKLPSASKISFLLVLFKNFLPAVKDAVVIAFKTFKNRAKGIKSAENILAKEKKDDFENILPDQTPLAEDDKENNRKDIKEDEETEGTVQKKPVLGILSHKRLIAIAGIFLIFMAAATGMYIKYTPSNSGDNEKTDLSAKAKENRNSETGFFDMLSSFLGKKPVEHMSPAEKLQAMGIKYTEAEFVKYAGRNDIEIVDFFIDSGMNINSNRPIDGVTPLISAASYNRLEMVKYLLAHGADINAKNNEGETALMKAIKYNRSKIVEVLLEYGADYNLADSRGNTALTIAREDHTNMWIKELFAKYGQNVFEAQKVLPDKELDLNNLPPASNNLPAAALENQLETTRSNGETELTLEDLRRILLPHD